jgi:hypothetical protein
MIAGTCPKVCFCAKAEGDKVKCRQDRIRGKFHVDLSGRAWEIAVMQCASGQRRRDAAERQRGRPAEGPES